SVPPGSCAARRTGTTPAPSPRRAATASSTATGRGPGPRGQLPGPRARTTPGRRPRAVAAGAAAAAGNCRTETRSRSRSGWSGVPAQRVGQALPPGGPGVGPRRQHAEAADAGGLEAAVMPVVVVVGAPPDARQGQEQQPIGPPQHLGQSRAAQDPAMLVV